MVSLLLMVVITVLALGAHQMMSARTLSAAKLQEHEAAFQEAEAALLAGERVVSDPAFTSTPASCSIGRCPVYAANVLDLSAARRSSDWWRAHASKYTPKNSVDNRPGNTWFVVEEFASSIESPASSSSTEASRLVYYRVTSASADDQGIQIVLQSFFARYFSAESGERDRSSLTPVIAGRQSWRQIR